MLSGNGRGRVADQAVKSKGGRLIIKFTQRDGYGSSIEFIERRGSDGADVDEKNNGFGPACRNSKRLVEYIGGFAAVQTFVSKTTYLTSAAIGMAESKVAGADGDITAAAFIIQFEAGVEIVASVNPAFSGQSWRISVISILTPPLLYIILKNSLCRNRISQFSCMIRHCILHRDCVQ